MNTSRRNSKPINHSTSHNEDWHMNLKTYSQDVGQVASQLANLLSNLKRGRSMLESGETGVSPERRYGILGIERLRNTGRIMLRVVDGNDKQIGQTVQICAPISMEKFMKDEKTGLVVPMNKNELIPWKESLKLAIKVVGDALKYVEMGKFIERARLCWDNVDELGPLAEAIQHNLILLNLEGDEEGAGILRSYLTRLIWPVCNGRPFATLEEGFDAEFVDERPVGCWIYSQTAVVCQRAAELQKLQLAELEHREFETDPVVSVAPEAQTVAPTAFTKEERQALVAKAQKVVSLKAGAGPVPQPEMSLTEQKPAAEAVVPQDA